MPLLRCLLLLSLLLAGGAAAQAQAPLPAPGGLCRAAIATAEREARIPPRLLSAMGRVESGRRDPTTGGFDPWPWTINAEGRGSFFPSKPAAIAAVRELQAQGVRSIDVGCMQINLRHHPNAFASLEEAFDPLANARYAARFLSELQATRGDWMLAAAHYHSQTPELAAAYRARIASALEAERTSPAPVAATVAVAVPAPQPQPPPVPVPVFQPGQAGGGFLLSNRMERAPMLAAPAGGGGRGLDAYRTLPIPLAGRGPALAGRL
jgi:Transglycosylase SLT domain